MAAGSASAAALHHLHVRRHDCHKSEPQRSLVWGCALLDWEIFLTRRLKRYSDVERKHISIIEQEFKTVKSKWFEFSNHFVA